MNDRDRSYGGKSYEPRERKKPEVRPEDYEDGVVKFLHRDGYGFVSREGKDDAYFHMERLVDDVRETVVQGSHVQIACGTGKKGPVVMAMRLA